MDRQTEEKILKKLRKGRDQLVETYIEELKKTMPMFWATFAAMFPKASDRAIYRKYVLLVNASMQDEEQRFVRRQLTTDALLRGIECVEGEK